MFWLLLTRLQKMDMGMQRQMQRGTHCFQQPPNSQRCRPGPQEAEYDLWLKAALPTQLGYLIGGNTNEPVSLPP